MANKGAQSGRPPLGGRPVFWAAIVVSMPPSTHLPVVPAPTPPAPILPPLASFLPPSRVIPAKAGIQRGMGGAPPNPPHARLPLAFPTPLTHRRGDSRSARPAAAGPPPSATSSPRRPIHPPSSYRRKPVSRGARHGASPSPPSHPPHPTVRALPASVRPEPVEGPPTPPAAPPIVVPHRYPEVRQAGDPPSPSSPPPRPPHPSRRARHPDTALLPPFPSLRYRLPMAITISHRNRNITGPHAFGGLSLVIGGMVRIDGQGWLGKYQEGLFILCKKILGFVANLCQASYKSISKTTSPSVTVATPRYSPPMEHEIPNANPNRALRAVARHARTVRIEDHMRFSPRQPEVVSHGRKNGFQDFVAGTNAPATTTQPKTTSRSDTRTRDNPRRPCWLPSPRQCGGLRAPPNGCAAAWVSLCRLSRYNGRTP